MLTDWVRCCSLFLDLQTELQRTPPLLLRCGEAAGCGFSLREEEGSSGTGNTSRFPWWEALLVCHRFTEEKHNGGCKHTAELPVGDPLACSNNRSIYTEHP